MTDDLEFDRAEPAEGGAAAGAVCETCDRPITSTYFEAAGKVLCPECKAVLARTVGARGNYPRGLLFGILGGALGALVYFGVTALTGYEIGLIAILVGWLVGKGVAAGAGAGGRRYQVTAVALTYGAIAISYGALLIKELATDPALRAALRPTDSLAAPAPGNEAVALGPADQAAAADSLAVDEPNVGIGVALGGALLGALALPLIVGLGDLPGSLLGLLIVGIGLWQAWQMTGRPNVAIAGPYSVGGRAPDRPNP